MENKYGKDDNLPLFDSQSKRSWQKYEFNHSVENAGVAFVKEADDRNKFFEKVNNQLCMTNKCGRTRQRTNNLRDELIWGMIRQ